MRVSCRSLFRTKLCALTRQLIELGGLVVKADLVALTNDDRAVIYGALLEVAAALHSDRREQALTLWCRHGRRGFAAMDEETGG